MHTGPLVVRTLIPTVPTAGARYDPIEGRAGGVDDGHAPRRRAGAQPALRAAQPDDRDAPGNRRRAREKGRAADADDGDAAPSGG